MRPQVHGPLTSRPLTSGPPPLGPLTFGRPTSGPLTLGPLVRGSLVRGSLTLGSLTLGIFALALSASCAIPGPPALIVGAPTAPDPSLSPSLALIEGQPRGALLEVRLPADPALRAACDKLVLLRRTLGEPGAEDFYPHYTFERAEQAALWEGGAVPFLDAGLEIGRRYEYAAVALVKGEVAATAQAVSVWWQEAPAPPEEVVAEAIGGLVLVRWEAVEGLGAIVFRREVAQGGWARVGAEISGGAFVDGGAKPGVVYVYMVSAFRLTQGAPMIGAPSAQVYVEARALPPEGGEKAPPPPKNAVDGGPEEGY